MINLREVEDAIKQLETSSSTYNNCMKLASLYIIRKQLSQRQGQDNYTNYSYYRPYYEHEGKNWNTSYGYKPMMYHDDNDLMIKRDMMDHERRS